MEPLIVTRAEAGQKLLNFLERRVENTPIELHRWIRTGQVRRNGGRLKPFDRVEAGDSVRVPPFARLRENSVMTKPERTNTRTVESGSPESTPWIENALPIVFENTNILIINKPAGLPSQGGTGHADSVADRLIQHYAGADFVPAPAHRLDKDTSGLLVSGKTYAALRALTDALAGRTGETPRKEYMAWVWGEWPCTGKRELCDILKKDDKTHRMRTLTPTEDTSETGREARCLVQPWEHRTLSGRPASLMLVRLFTGRTHQIRVQLASRGYPVVGDPRYGDGHDQTNLKLHALRLSFPASLAWLAEEHHFICPPPWAPPWQPTLLPDQC